MFKKKLKKIFKKIESNLESDLLCCICMNAKVIIRFISCNHSVVFEGFFENLNKNIKYDERIKRHYIKCPICKADVTDSSRIEY